jgi:hypothetical protein|tara:strand:+ start:960 stop:1154 length:195 start_codon:yes stop_codon:yes gene_type:complete
MIEDAIACLLVLAWNGFLIYKMRCNNTMDYLDYELQQYQEQKDAYCDTCGEAHRDDCSCSDEEE